MKEKYDVVITESTPESPDETMNQWTETTESSEEAAVSAAESAAQRMEEEGKPGVLYRIDVNDLSSDPPLTIQSLWASKPE